MRVYLLVLLVAAAVTYVAVPIVRHVALVSNALTPVRARDVHSTPIPRLGGVAMFVGFASAVTVASQIPYLADVIDSSAWAVVLGAGMVCFLGVVDDLWELDWWAKLSGQILAAGVMAWRGVQLITFPVGGVTLGSSRLSLFSTVLVVLAVINAVNFVDGLDGLAAGIIGIGASAFFLYVYVLTRTTQPASYTSLAATVIAALIGICVGFLPHNFHPSTIFMGDSGSLALGGAMVAFALFTRTELLLLVIALIPVLEVFSVIVQKFVFKTSRKRSVAAGEKPLHAHRYFRMTPFHHHMEKVGVNGKYSIDKRGIAPGTVSSGEVNSVFRLWVVNALCVLVALALFFGDWFSQTSGVIH